MTPTVDSAQGTSLPSFGDRYRVERELGRGGMATVFLAFDTQTEKRVAIKLLHPDLAQAVGGERFHREIRIATGLTHPNILPAFESGEIGGSLYYVMPYVEGESLRDRITRERQLAVQDAVRIAGEIANALHYAHTQNIVHRDIKPENILLEGERAVLADFGIARAVTAVADAEHLTQTGMSLGTPSYMSPEQALGERNIDGRSDQYSLGCVLYEMLAGAPPFQANTMQALVAKHLGEAVPMITTVRPAVPDEIEDVVMRALEKVPADRFSSMKEFADSLTNVIATTGTWARRTGRVTPLRTTRTSNRALPAQPASRVKPWLLAGAAMLLVGAGVGITMWRQSRQTFAVQLAGSMNALGYQNRRVAVPYFRDVSATKRFGEVASGLTEGLLGQLSQVQDLDIVSKSDVAVYRDSTLSRESLARAFQSAWLVEGTVDEDGPEMSVTVKLIDAISGPVATETFKAPAGSALALRDSLVITVAEKLRQQIGGELKLNAKRAETNNDNAWLLVQQADKFRRDAEAAADHDDVAAMNTAFSRADSLLARAEELDRNWPEPVIQRSYVSYRRARAAEVPSEKLKLYNASIAHATRVIAADSLNPQAAAAYEYRGIARFLAFYEHLFVNQREADAAYAASVRDLERATTLAPRNAGAWTALSTMYAHKPDFASAKLAAVNAFQRDEYSLQAADILDHLYRMSYISETFNDADMYCAKGRARYPADPRFIECALWTYTIAEIRPDPLPPATIDTVWMLADSIQKLSSPARREFFRREAHIVAGIVLGRLDRADSARRVLDKVLETPKEADPENELMSYNAYARETLGDRKKAIEIIKTYLTRNPEHCEGWVKDSAWWWRELKQDREFQRLIATCR